MLAAVVPMAGGIGGVADLLATHVVRVRLATAACSGEAGFRFPSSHSTGFVATAVAALPVLPARTVVRSAGLWLAVVVVLVAAVRPGVLRARASATVVLVVDRNLVSTRRGPRGDLGAGGRRDANRRNRTMNPSTAGPGVVARDQILVVEDDDAIAVDLALALSAQGCDVTHVRTGRGALDHVGGVATDLVVLDIGLPDIDGLEVCRQLRSRDPLLPVVLLTARQEEIDIVVGLDAGAVDYVTKPFRLAEVLTRVRVQLRRVDPDAADQAPLIAGGLRIDGAGRRAWWHDNELDLRAKELDLLMRLATDAGRVVTRETLMSDVWEEHWFGSTKTLDVHIASLRRRLTDDGATTDPITTLRGVGYRSELS